MKGVLGSVSLTLIVLHFGCTSAGQASQKDDCPVCHKPVADGPEVRVVRHGEPEPGTRYRCFMCPIMEGETPGTWTMRAASGLDGRWVTFRVDGDRVASDPPTAVVLSLAVRPGDECLDVHRVFVDESEFRRYVQLHPGLESAPPRRFEEILAESRRPKRLE